MCRAIETFRMTFAVRLIRTWTSLVISWSARLRAPGLEKCRWSVLKKERTWTSERDYEESQNEKIDELRPEHDLKNLKVRKLGPGRKSFADIVRLEPDVAEAFPDADSVNEALRSLIRVPKNKTPSIRRTT